jgi:SAM-dependent methyltransferase
VPNVLTALDLVEGFHLAHVVTALHELGVLRTLRETSSASEAAARCGLATDLLVPLLDYVAGRTELVDKHDDQFSTTRHYDAFARFQLDQYIGVYGTNARAVAELLREPAHAACLANLDRHAQAYAEFGDPGVGLIVDLVAQLGLNHVLDLGCGPGSTLLALARRSADFIGWGIDSNPAMIAAARQRLRAAGVAERVEMFEGNLADLNTALPLHIRPTVQCIVAVSLVDAFFAAGNEQVISWLRLLSELLPGRALLLADYYGRLGKVEPPWPRQTALHDLVQLLSGQGVPPADRVGWSELYAAAGCTLIHVVEDEESTGFIHILRT